MLACADLADFDPYLHGELDFGHLRSIALHLAGCPGCRARLAGRRPVADAVPIDYLVAHIHDETDPAAKRFLQAHLPWCEPCRDELVRLGQADADLVKGLSQYRLPKRFRQNVMARWKPHRRNKTDGATTGLAGMLNRAEAGNVFSFQQLLERFKAFAHLSAFLATGDFRVAGAVAAEAMASGFPSLPATAGTVDFLRWIDEKTEVAARARGEDDPDAAGLSRFADSRKLRRHRAILGVVREMRAEWRMPFLLRYVERWRYGEIAALLGMEREAVRRVLSEAVRFAADRLAGVTGDAPERIDAGANNG